MYSRKTLFTIVSLVAVLAFAAGCTAAAAPGTALAGGGPTNAQSIGAAPQAAVVGQGITVIGTGKVSGTPDVAYITVGIDTEASSVQQAVNDNKSKMTALLATLKGLGVEDKDIRTTNYSVYTQRAPVVGSNGSGDNGPITYHVSNQVSVTVRDVSQLGEVLDKAVAAGANNIYGVNFSVADPSKLEADARAKAVADAKARAQDLAKLAGVNLGDVVSVSEVVGGPVYNMPQAMPAAGLGGGGAPIQPGELEVSVSIQITYAIK